MFPSLPFSTSYYVRKALIVAIRVVALPTDETTKNGGTHYPHHAAKIQLGIWDASNPLGTSQWAKGPIDWEKAPERMTAVVKSVSVECA